MINKVQDAEAVTVHGIKTIYFSNILHSRSNFAFTSLGCVAYENNLEILFKNYLEQLQIVTHVFNKNYRYFVIEMTVGDTQILKTVTE